MELSIIFSLTHPWHNSRDVCEADVLQVLQIAWRLSGALEITSNSTKSFFSLQSLQTFSTGMTFIQYRSW